MATQKMLSSIKEIFRGTFIVEIDGEEGTRVVPTQSLLEAQDWIDDVFRSCPQNQNLVIGFGLDTVEEHRTESVTHSSSFNLLKLSVGPLGILLLLLEKNQRVPDFLIKFFSDKRFTFVGVGLKVVTQKLQQEHSIKVSKCRDIEKLAMVQRGEKSDIYHLASDFICVEYNSLKPQEQIEWFSTTNGPFENPEKVKQASVETNLYGIIGQKLLDIVDGVRKKHVQEKVTLNQGSKYCSWRHPTDEIIKLNVDGSYKRDRTGNQTGCGGLFRDKHGFWLCGFYCKLKVNDSIKAELSAVLEGLKLAREMGFRDIIVETDCKSVHQIMMSDITKYPTRSLEYQCLELKNDFNNKEGWTCEVEWVYREANECADKLAKLGAKSQTDKLEFLTSPPIGISLIKFLLMDIHRVGYCRFSK